MRSVEFWAMHAAIAAGGGLLVVLFGRRPNRLLDLAFPSHLRVPRNGLTYQCRRSIGVQRK